MAAPVAGRERDRPATGAVQAREQTLGDFPDDLDVDDLRPPGSTGPAPFRER